MAGNLASHRRCLNSSIHRFLSDFSTPCLRAKLSPAADILFSNLVGHLVNAAVPFLGTTFEIASCWIFLNTLSESSAFFNSDATNKAALEEQPSPFHISLADASAANAKACSSLTATGLPKRAASLSQISSRTYPSSPTKAPSFVTFHPRPTNPLATSTSHLVTSPRTTKSSMTQRRSYHAPSI